MPNRKVSFVSVRAWMERKVTAHDIKFYKKTVIFLPLNITVCNNKGEWSRDPAKEAYQKFTISDNRFNLTKLKPTPHFFSNGFRRLYTILCR
jgi:hypothetical protein